ncbi:hybrid sensor histidine kinase/response regulator [Zavarzinia compransoris]|nr:ATP-binding protein [Zavarzinia compransoris]TDP47711.1 Na+/proline symporter [Zavarzinia compransoris]
MVQDWAILLMSLIYIGSLFAIAYLGDWRPRRAASSQNLIYALSLAIYCTSWTFYGSVGRAVAAGWDFFLIFVGPILVMIFGQRLLSRMILIARNQNITSIADFIGSRYGKSRAVSAIVAGLAIVGVLPYIALQLKAVSDSFDAVTGLGPSATGGGFDAWRDTALIVAVMMAAFTMLFGIRRAQATEQHRGMMLAIAFESLVKLAAFIAVGLYVTYEVFGGVGGLVQRIAADPGLERFRAPEVTFNWLTMVVLSSLGFLCLPRQFHVAVIEHGPGNHLPMARWLFPLYLVLINLFVVPIAIAGMDAALQGNSPDMLVLVVPMMNDQSLLSTFVFIGGLSAATSMVIVACLALSIMASNEIAMPFLLRWRRLDRLDSGRVVVVTRRVAVVVILTLGYLYERALVSQLPLVSIGLISFAAVAQFAPALLFGLYWRGAHRNGAVAGLAGGGAVWLYGLFLPSMLGGGAATATPFAFLLPDWLAALDPLTQGVFVSLGVNTLLLVGISLASMPQKRDRDQADAYVAPQVDLDAETVQRAGAAMSIDELKGLSARFIGTEQAEQAYAGIERTGVNVAAFTERLLSGVIGAASARVVLASARQGSRLSGRAMRAVLGEASEAIRQNFTLLRTTLDHVSQGIAVFDRERRLVTWNDRFFDMLWLPRDQARVGTSNGELGVVGRLRSLGSALSMPVGGMATVRQVERPDGARMELRFDPMPGGGFSIMVTDVTERYIAEAALKTANESLERRVTERTADLTRVISELHQARTAAEEANLGKTRFLAAASHDLLQPLHAARLFATALADRHPDEPLVAKVDQGLGAVEGLLDALLDISRLDQGVMTPDWKPVALGPLMEAIASTLAPLAAKRGVEIMVMPSSLAVRSDPQLLRRVIQNYLSNAIRYSDPARPRCRVLIGARRQGAHAVIEVWDSGPGIEPEDQATIFGEFVRLGPKVEEQGAKGLGLGLAIVERICRILDHPIGLRSQPGRGSVFTVAAPLTEAPAPRRIERTSLPPVEAGETRLLVLAIDDEAAIREAISALLKGWACDVLTAGSLEAAREVMRGAGRLPDVILVDYHLGGGMNGLSVITALRQQAGRLLAAALITADREPRLRQEAKRHQVEMLPKPVKPAALRAYLDHLRKSLGLAAAG